MRGLIEWVPAFAIGLTVACGATHEEPIAPAPHEAREEPAPVAPAPDVAAPSATTLPAMPYSIASGAPRPPSGSPEDALVARWAHILGIDSTRNDYSLTVTRAERSLLGSGAILWLQGTDPNATPEQRLMGAVPQRVEQVLVEDDRAGRRIVVRLADENAVLPPTSGALRPWLAGVFACEDEVLASRVDLETLEASCEDLLPRVAATLRERLTDEATRRDETQGFLNELYSLGAASGLVDIEASGPLRGERMRGARFVPFAATTDATGITVTGTVRVSATCVPTVEQARFVLRVTDQTVTLERAPLARERLQTRCQ